jgi:hypothetical protein
VKPAKMTKEQVVKYLGGCIRLARVSKSGAEGLRVRVHGSDEQEAKTLADEIAAFLEKDLGRKVVRSSVKDGPSLGTKDAKLRSTHPTSVVTTGDEANRTALDTSIGIMLIDGLTSDMDSQDLDVTYDVEVISNQGSVSSRSSGATSSSSTSRRTNESRFMTVVNLHSSTSATILDSSFPTPKAGPLSSIFRIRFKPLTVPLSRWLIQVVLFLAISLLNNAAFAYRIPMSVHIVFRSGGLCVSMVMGWLIDGKRYSWRQVGSILLVTVGIATATLSAAIAKGRANVSTSSATTHYLDYTIGIGLLFLALVLSSMLGLAQERTYKTFGKADWQEGLFYLHFLALPMFTLMGNDLAHQIRVANTSPPIELRPDTLLVSLFLPTGRTSKHEPALPVPLFSWIPPVSVPSFYIPLLLNCTTQLICISGVHRLTSHVSSLTVTLVLAIRKAVSLGISIIILGGGSGNAWLWGGAAAVLVGTVGYAMDSGGGKRVKDGADRDAKKRR